MKIIELEEELKTCSRCLTDKPRSEFNPRARNRDGLEGFCRQCKNERAKKYRTPESTRRYNLRYRVGLDDESIEYVFVLDGDPCSYCGRPSEEIDHIDPSSADGESHWSNLTASCRSCNSAKKTRSLLVALAFRNGCLQAVPPGGSILIFTSRGERLFV